MTFSQPDIKKTRAELKKLFKNVLIIHVQYFPVLLFKKVFSEENKFLLSHLPPPSLLLAHKEFNAESSHAELCQLKMLHYKNRIFQA
jgi:hypothetical protein